MDTILEEEESLVRNIRLLKAEIKRSIDYLKLLRWKLRCIRKKEVRK